MIVREKNENGINAITISETGLKHAALDEPNQDSNALFIKGTDLVMAVADGVGSCKMAGIASEKACGICLGIFEILVSGNSQASCEEIALMITDRWNEFLEGKDGNEYCTTLKAVFVVNGILSAVSVGDGVLMVESEGEVISSPEDDNDFLNQTNCLSPGIGIESVWLCQKNIGGKAFSVFMSTDGVSNSIVAGQETDLIREISGIDGEEKLKDELMGFFNDIRLVSADDMTLGVIRYGS